MSLIRGLPRLHVGLAGIEKASSCNGRRKSLYLPYQASLACCGVRAHVRAYTGEVLHPINLATFVGSACVRGVRGLAGQRGGF
jgi:hypothetical protein